MKQKTKDNLYFGLIATTLVLLAVFIYLLGSSGFACQRNPFVYGAENINENTGKQVYCSCNVAGTNQHFTFNEEGIFIGE